jgi:hypothetical protein
MIGIPQLLIESCNLCQNRCKNCAHQGMRDDDPTYQMSLDEIKILIDHFLKIDCKIGNIDFHGPAEPLLWRHLNEAILLFAASKLTDTAIIDGVRIKIPLPLPSYNGQEQGIMVITNGRLLHALDNIISNEAWDKITLFGVSLYGYPIDKTVLNRHPGKIIYFERPIFHYINSAVLPYQAFGGCCCSGPMYYKGMIYPYCGPPLFDACLRAKIDHKKFCMPVTQYNPAQPINMPFQTFLPCAWCWANNAIPKYPTAHKF